jgi:hypothetical protein
VRSTMRINSFMFSSLSRVMGKPCSIRKRLVSSRYVRRWVRGGWSVRKDAELQLTKIFSRPWHYSLRRNFGYDIVFFSGALGFSRFRD